MSRASSPTRPMTAKPCGRRSRGAASSTGSLGSQASPLSARDLAAVSQRLGGQRSFRRRARLRDDEALVRHAPRPLHRSFAQRLPSAIRGDRDEHEAGARSDARGLSPTPGRGAPKTRSDQAKHPNPTQNSSAALSSSPKSTPKPDAQNTLTKTHHFCEALRSHPSEFQQNLQWQRESPHPDRLPTAEG